MLDEQEQTYLNTMNVRIDAIDGVMDLIKSELKGITNVYVLTPGDKLDFEKSGYIQVPVITLTDYLKRKEKLEDSIHKLKRLTNGITL